MANARNKAKSKAKEQRVSAGKAGARRELPAIGDPKGSKIKTLTRELIDEAMFG